MGRAVICALALGVAGCGGDETSETRTPAASGASLTGTWEIIGTGVTGFQESVIVTVSPSTLTVERQASSGGSVSGVAHGDTFDVTYQECKCTAAKDFTADRTAGPGDTGIIPLPLFGDWNMHTPTT